MKDLRIQYKNTDSLVPYVRNAKDHPQHQIDELVSLIKQFGFVNPLIIDQAHEIIAGHGRLLAAKQMGMEKVPCVIINHLTEDQRKALRLADNKVSSKSTWNWKNLSDELNALKISDFDLAFTAFEQSELDALIDSASAIIPDIEELEHAPRIPHEAVPHDPASKPPPKEVSGELTRMDSPRPKATDDEYSNFELVMLHPNKVRLVELLARIKERNGLEKVEEAMMLLVDSWED